MSIRVKRRRDGGLVITLPWLDALVLRGLPARMHELLSDRESNQRIVARLFPPAYEDPAREAEYRKLVGDDLKRRKMEAVAAFRKTLADWTLKGLHVEVVVPAGGADDWLAFINDMRLVLGMELDIREDGWSEEFDPDHPRAPDFAMLHYLGWLEEEIVRALSAE